MQKLHPLVLHGDYDIVPLACATHIAQTIPMAHLVVLNGCGLSLISNAQKKCIKQSSNS